MRFSTLAALSVALVAAIVPSTVMACERECQQNVSHAFEAKYQILSDQHFLEINHRLDEGFLYGLPPQTLSPQESETALTMMKTSLDPLKVQWSTPLFKKIFDMIFAVEPKFKGDCNHPHRVTQPPKGVWWKMPDCHNMDYICGNPPSICHFMPMIKTRIVTALRQQLQDMVDGDQSTAYSDYLAPALETVVTQFPALTDHTALLHGNLNEILQGVKDQFADFAEETTWPQAWDLEIKELLLTFP